MHFWEKSMSGLDWSGYPLDCYDYKSTQSFSEGGLYYKGNGFL